MKIITWLLSLLIFLITSKCSIIAMQPTQWIRNTQLQEQAELQAAEAEENIRYKTQELGQLAENISDLPKKKEARQATKELAQLAKYFSYREPYGGKNALIKQTKDLLERGANPNILHDSAYADYPIALAIPENPEIVELLLQAGANPDTISATTKEAIIFDAIHENSVSIVNSILRHNANLNVSDRHRNTPLFYTILFDRDPEIINALIQHHADPNKANIDGIFPLTLAVNKHNIHLIKLLLQAGANPDAYDKKQKRSIRALVLEGTRSTNSSEKALYQLMLDMFNMYSAQRKAKIL